jgi:hypothetical protein
MQMKTLMIDVAAKLLLDATLWAKVKKLVSNMNSNDNLTGAEKHAQVLSDLKAVFSELGTSILNLAISLAVVWAKKQTGQ